MSSYTMTEARARLAELGDAVEKTHDRVKVTRNGRVSFVMISEDELESMEETLEILSNPDLVADLRQGQQEIENGDYISGDEAKAWADKMMARTRGK